MEANGFYSHLFILNLLRVGVAGVYSYVVGFYSNMGVFYSHLGGSEWFLL